MRKRMDGGLSLTTLQKMLETVKEPKSYGNFRMSTTPVYKRSFAKYVHWCIDHDFLSRTPSGIYTKNGVIYLTTEKGRQFLDLIA